MSIDTEITLEDAQEHVVDVRALDELAHAIALGMSELSQRTPPPRLQRLVKQYAALHRRVVDFKDRHAAQMAQPR